MRVELEKRLDLSSHRLTCRHVDQYYVVIPCDIPWFQELNKTINRCGLVGV